MLGKSEKLPYLCSRVGEMGELAETNSLLNCRTGKPVPRVRIPLSPLLSRPQERLLGNLAVFFNNNNLNISGRSAVG